MRQALVCLPAFLLCALHGVALGAYACDLRAGAVDLHADPFLWYNAAGFCVASFLSFTLGRQIAKRQKVTRRLVVMAALVSIVDLFGTLLLAIATLRFE